MALRDTAQRIYHDESGKRVTYKDRYRGQDVILKATILVRISDPHGSYYRINPDRLEEYGNITHFQRNLKISDVIEVIDEVK